jgi:hypothetical protein
LFVTKQGVQGGERLIRSDTGFNRCPRSSPRRHQPRYTQSEFCHTGMVRCEFAGQREECLHRLLYLSAVQRVRGRDPRAQQFKQSSGSSTCVPDVFSIVTSSGIPQARC